MAEARRSSEADRAERQLTGGEAFQTGNDLINQHDITDSEAAGEQRSRRKLRSVRQHRLGPKQSNPTGGDELIRPATGGS